MNETPIGQEPKMIRTGAGRMVPVSKPFGAQRPITKKFLVVIQHYDGDVEFAEELASLICDLERTRNHDADIMLVRRADSRQMSTTVISKLESKFDTVHYHRCRRHAKGYPFSPNEMWYDLVMLMAQTAPYASDYYAFVNLEPDAVPTRPGWIGELIAAWKDANSEGKAAIGFIHDNPRRHMNGLAVYASDLYLRVGSRILMGGSPQVCFDIRHSASILPLAKASPLIHFHYRHSTTTPAEVFAEVNGVAPAIFHGVKDRSALIAVRDRHINMRIPAPPVSIPLVGSLEGSSFTGADAFNAIVKEHTEDVRAVMAPAAPPAPVARSNVYTYYHKLTGTTYETQAILDLWRKGWVTRGWNPIILTYADAVKNAKFEDFEAALAKLPCAGADRKRWAHQFYRWLALDSAGGGLLTDYDVLPGDFTPAQFEPVNGWSTSTWFFRQADGGDIFGAFLSESAGLPEWIEHVMNYDAQPDDLQGDQPHVTDSMMANHYLHGKSHAAADLAHFDSERVGKGRKSLAMEKFLAGK